MCTNRFFSKTERMQCVKTRICHWHLFFERGQFLFFFPYLEICFNSRTLRSIEYRFYSRTRTGSLCELLLWCTYVHMQMPSCTYYDVCIYACVCVYMMYACAYVCIIFVYMFLCVYMYIYVFKYVWHLHACVYTYKHRYIHVSMH